MNWSENGHNKLKTVPLLSGLLYDSWTYKGMQLAAVITVDFSRPGNSYTSVFCASHHTDVINEQQLNTVVIA